MAAKTAIIKLVIKSIDESSANEDAPVVVTVLLWGI